MRLRRVPFLQALTYALAGRTQNAAVDWQTHSGDMVDLAPERLADQALARGYRHLFFLDDDIVPPLGIIDRLLGWRYPVTTGVYERRVGGLAQGLFENYESLKWRSLGWPSATGDLALISATGAGCLLIDTRILRRMSRPWFHYSEEGSEDMFFCRKLQLELLIPVLCDTTARCKHETSTYLEPGGVTSTLEGPVQPAPAPPEPPSATVTGAPG